MNFSSYYDMQREKKVEDEALVGYMSGEVKVSKVAMDCGGTSCGGSSGSPHFKEEDHPRGGKGSGKGGKFVKSNKTIAKEDALETPKEKKPEEKKEDAGVSKASAKIENIKKMQKEYKSRLNTLMEYAGKMHGGFTDVAMSLSRFREKLKREIRSLGDYGYEVTGSLTGDISFGKTKKKAVEEPKAASKPKVSHVPGGDCHSCH